MGVRSWMLRDPPNKYETCVEGIAFMIDGVERTVHINCIKGTFRAFIYDRPDVIGVGDSANTAIDDLESRLGCYIFEPVT